MLKVKPISKTDKNNLTTSHTVNIYNVSRRTFSLDKIFKFYKPSSVLLKLKMVYEKVENLIQWKNLFVYSILYISETGRVWLYKLTNHFF